MHLMFCRFAPYQIALHDGRLIFAPQDADNVIRLRPPPAEDAPSSPEFVSNEDGDYEGDDNDEDMDQDYDDDDDEEEEAEEEA
jgi:hypothetical protein